MKEPSTDQTTSHYTPTPHEAAALHHLADALRSLWDKEETAARAVQDRTGIDDQKLEEARTLVLLGDNYECDCDDALCTQRIARLIGIELGTVKPAQQRQRKKKKTDS